MKNRPSLFEFTDFREYLSAWVLWKKGQGKFSFRKFAQQAGYSSPNIMQAVIEGKKKLATTGIRKFVTGLGLSPEESDYFENLVLMNQAQAFPERMKYYQRIARYAAGRTTRLSRAQLPSMFGHWLTPVLYEMVLFPDFRPEPAWIAKQFQHPPAEAEIKRALEALVSAGLVCIDGGGAWRQNSDSLLASGDNVRDIALFEYHETALLKLADALVGVPMTERSFNVLTMAVPSGLVPEIRRKLEGVEAEILSMVEAHPEPKNVVINVNWYLFPVLRKEGHS